MPAKTGGDPLLIVVVGYFNAVVWRVILAFDLGVVKTVNLHYSFERLSMMLRKLSNNREAQWTDENSLLFFRLWPRLIS